ncbi:MAG: 30S ribosomal protein S4 [Nitrospirota bacterium]|jgi:small subunit ribosomal protein S4
MARYRGALCRVCRRELEKLYLKGDRCYTDKCSVERRRYPPGQHGQRRSKISDYGIQLREKQKVRHGYGLLMEKQFRRYFEEASRKKGVTGELLLQFLERRLDNMVYRMGFADNRRQARQLVRHGFVTVNGRRVDIPSFLLGAGDTVGMSEKGRKIPSVSESMEKAQHRGIPGWVALESEQFRARVERIPSRDEIPVTAQEQLIVELYSK